MNIVFKIGSIDVESPLVVLPSRNLVEEEEVAYKKLPLKRGKETLKSLNLRTMVREGGFEATLSTIKPYKGLIYLSAQCKGLIFLCCLIYKPPIPS